MKKKVYSYRLRQEVFFLNEEEHEILGKALNGIGMTEFEIYMKGYGGPFKPPQGSYTKQAMDIYERITGERLSEPYMLLHVRQSSYGSLCPSCNKPFRTPRAKLCAECGYQLPEGKLAGPLEL